MTREEIIKGLEGYIPWADEYEVDIEVLTGALELLKQEQGGDLISRQAVLDVLEKEGHKWGNDYRDWVDAIEEIKKLPPVNPHETVTEFADRCRECGARYGKLLKQEQSGDLISRQAVIDAIDKWVKNMGVLIALPATSEVTPLFESIHELPPVNPQPKAGHWIALENRFDLGDRVKCSECGQVFVVGDDVSRHYCPNCGAKMIKPQESEVNNG